MQSSKPNARSEADLAAELATLRQEMASMLGRIRTFGAEGIDWAAAATQGKASGLLAELEKMEQMMADRARANPIKTLGIAALVGLVVGFLLRR